VKPGAAYADAIVRAINEASALVMVLSGAAMASEHVSREVERAASHWTRRVSPHSPIFNGVAVIYPRQKLLSGKRTGTAP